MFDLRYHVASLAAVFFALVIGILVGVALASHGLGNAERKKLEAELHSAQGQVTDLKGTIQEDRAETEFATAAYDAVMANRLRGARVAVLFVGPVDPGIRKAVGDTLNDSGASVARMSAIVVPVNAGKIENAVAKRPALASYATGRTRFSNIGRELASEFVSGGDTPLWDALDSQLVETRVGGGKRPADGVVVVRTAEPQTRLASAQVVSGLFAGFADAGMPAVGVENRGTFPSAVRTYKHFGLSSVDDIDLRIGRVALAVLLSQAGIKGNYGLQDVDDSIVPLIPPVATSTTGG
jgi:hypothetical protein